jgi:hypothetical protein
LDFGEGPEEEDPQGPKLVSRRLSSGCWDRFVGVTYQKQMTTKKMSSAPRHSDGEKGMRDTHCVMHPHL